LSVGVLAGLPTRDGGFWSIGAARKKQHWKWSRTDKKSVFLLELTGLWKEHFGACRGAGRD